MKWIANTSNITRKARKRLIWMLKRLKNLGADERDLLVVYTKQIRSIMKLVVPAWQSAISQAEIRSRENPKVSMQYHLRKELHQLHLL